MTAAAGIEDAQFHGRFFHLVRTALRAISVRRSAESFAALAGPPLRPPSLPKETAAAFLFFEEAFGREFLGMSKVY